MMKLVSYADNRSVSCGILTDAGIIDIPSAWAGMDSPRSVKEILTRGQGCLEKVAKLADKTDHLIALKAGDDSARLLAPVIGAGKLLGLAGNYTEHIQEVGLKLGLSDSPRYGTVPRPFLMPPTAVTGTGQTIPWPACSEKIDYELELAVVIGKRAKCIEPEESLDYVAGCTIANDVSARSVTFAKGRTARPWDEFYDWLSGKWADGFLPMGPYLLTFDEIEDVQNLEMALKVNGAVHQRANTKQMIFPVADIVSFLSHIMMLEPGDVIATGTPSGVGMASGRFLNAGDKIECTIEKLGTLVNYIGKPPEKFYEPLVRKSGS